MLVVKTPLDRRSLARIGPACTRHSHRVTMYTLVSECANPALYVLTVGRTAPTQVHFDGLGANPLGVAACVRVLMVTAHRGVTPFSVLVVMCETIVPRVCSCAELIEGCEGVRLLDELRSSIPKLVLGSLHVLQGAPASVVMVVASLRLVRMMVFAGVLRRH